jgi:hypothetical protein
MRSISLIIVIVALVSCQQETQTEKEVAVTQLNPETPVKEILEPTDCAVTNNIINNSDAYSCLDYKDSIVYQYEEYVVITKKHKEYNGDVVSVRNKITNSYLEVGTKYSCFFSGLHKKYLIIDEGTGQMRTLKIYDLIKEEMIFTTDYVGDLTISEGTLLFNAQVEIEDKSKIPECTKELQAMEYGIGYVEDLIYSFEKNELTRTEHYDCCYFE